MPTDGPVTQVQTSSETAAPPGIDFDPKPPQPGESASEIVTHFLEAMKARPISTSVARQFLSQDAQGAWRPNDAVVTYGELGDPVGGNLSVEVPLTMINEYDDRGAWQRSREAATLQVGLTSENGEWRISEVPDALDRPRVVVRGLLPAGLPLLLRPDDPDPGARARPHPRRRPVGLLARPGPAALGLDRPEDRPDLLPRGLHGGLLGADHLGRHRAGRPRPATPTRSTSPPASGC